MHLWAAVARDLAAETHLWAAIARARAGGPRASAPEMHLEPAVEQAWARETRASAAETRALGAETRAFAGCMNFL